MVIDNNLHNCALFQGITHDELFSLLDCLHTQTVFLEKNAFLWQIGDKVDACALVLSGSLRAESVDDSGKPNIMATHGPGALVGDVLMATPQGRSPVYVVANENSSLLILPYRHIMSGCSKCCQSHTRLRENLMGEIAQKFWFQRRKAAYLSQRSLRKRIAMYLMDESRSRGSTTFSLGITRENMANLLSVNRSALSRELSRMKSDRLIDCYRDTFRILNTDFLVD